MASLITAIRHGPFARSTDKSGTAKAVVSPRAMLLPLAMAQFLASYDSSSMNVAIINIAADLNTTVTGVQTTITLFTLTMAALMIPGQITMIPLYVVMTRIGWVDTHYPLIAPAYFGSAFGIFLMRQYFLTIPQDLNDAAKIDGCSHVGIYWRIMMPLAKPVIVGPHTFNFADATQRAVEVGAALRVADAAQLREALIALRGDAARRVRMGDAGRAFTCQHRGATARTVALIERLLEDRR